MRNLLLTFVCVSTVWSLCHEQTTSAANLESTEAPTAWVDYQDRDGQNHRLDENIQRVYGNHGSCSRCAGRYGTIGKDASSIETRVSTIKGSYREKRRKETTPIVWAKVITQHACECGQNCQCPPQVCKAGNCKHVYAVVFGSKNCKYCPRMYPVVDKLRADGYIVFYVDAGTYPKVWEQFKLRAVPTTIIMDGSIPMTKFVGITSANKIARHLKTQEQQGLKPRRTNNAN